MASEIHREYNRRFSNVKIQTDSGERQAFMETKQGLKKCLTEFFEWRKKISVPELERRSWPGSNLRR
jgi:hypothetical protein